MWNLAVVLKADQVDEIGAAFSVHKKGCWYLLLGLWDQMAREQTDSKRWMFIHMFQQPEFQASDEMHQRVKIERITQNLRLSL